MCFEELHSFIPSHIKIMPHLNTNNGMKWNILHPLIDTTMGQTEKESCTFQKRIAALNSALTFTHLE
jgi:hypothetical protein